MMKLSNDVCIGRYYQPTDISGTPAPDNEHVPRSSNDPCLTAFAQLGALRLNAKRGLITFSSRDTEYILAESGQTISLQKDDDEKDRLWHGAGALKRNKGIGQELVKTFCDPNTAPPYVVINDLTKDEAFKDKCIVTGHPFVRFLAAVPLRTPLHSMVIGNYIVVDDKPRDGLNQEEIQFMMDMGVTVMDYLEAARVNQKEGRAQRMVKAVGLFIQGKASLRDWWLEEGYKGQQSKAKKRVRKGVALDNEADIEFGVQDPPDQFTSRGIEGLSSHNHRESLGRLERSPSSSTLSHNDIGDHGALGDGRPAIPHTLSSSTDTTIPLSSFSRPAIERSGSATTMSTVGDPHREANVRHHSVAFDNPSDPTGADDSKELQEALLSNDLKGIFSRASNLIREARYMDGTIFYDASIGSFGGSSKKGIMDQKAPGEFHPDGTVSTSDDDQGLRTSDTDGSSSAQAHSDPPENSCNILGYSTRKRSSIRGHTPPDEYLKFPEAIMRRLLKRYPHGKVFNFEEDGSYSSSDDTLSGRDTEENDSGPQRFAQSDKKLQRKRISKEAEAAAILAVLPGARSVFFFPLWDPSRERWYAGTLLWSTCPTRGLCPLEDLTYLAAFGNSIMAEVARLSAQVLAQMKNDFISSISHELRSPLHGVLASVEFLQETKMTETQVEMVNNIHASGKVLLDTINHVLDFSKVNRKSKYRGKTARKNRKRSKKSGKDQETIDGAADDAADVCVLSEEVIESIYAGRNVSKLVMQASAGRRRASIHPGVALESPVTVIMDIGWLPSWTFDLDAGAWRRILMNLFSNAMKYTKIGYVKVSLHHEEEAASNRNSRSTLVLKVKDSGKGISQEFLKHHLYKPFTQEDSLATGAGLGLSIVRHIVHDLGGQIDFTSEQGTGTEAIVRIPLTAPILPPQIDGYDLLSEVRKKTKGVKFRLDGFDRYPDISEAPTGILSSDAEGAMYLKSSVESLMCEWFAMESTANSPSGGDDAEVEVIMESGIASMENKLQSYIYNASPSGKMTAIILCNAPPSSKIRSNEFFEVFYLQQP